MWEIGQSTTKRQMFFASNGGVVSESRNKVRIRALSSDCETVSSVLASVEYPSSYDQPHRIKEAGSKEFKVLAQREGLTHLRFRLLN